MNAGRITREVLTCLLLLAFSTSFPWSLVASGGGLDEGGSSSPRIQLVGYTFGDSEDFVHRCGRLQVGFSLAQNVSVQATSVGHWVSQDGDRLTGRGLNLLLGRKFGSRWEANLGVGFTDYQEVDTDVSFVTSLKGGPTQTSHLTLDYEHDNVAYGVKSLQALRASITSHQFSPSFYQWLSERWSFWGRFTLGRYSDGNRKISLESSLTCILKSDPQLSLSYGFGYLTYTERSHLYWDPSRYVGHYLISHVQRNIGDLLSVNLRGSIGFSSENKMNSGLSIGLALRHSPHWGLDVSGEYLGEPGRGENYSSANSSINIVWLP